MLLRLLFTPAVERYLLLFLPDAMLPCDAASAEALFRHFFLDALLVFDISFMMR